MSMKRCFFITLSVIALAACSGGEVRETLGVNHNAPDEFKVLSRPPLSVPPDFNLRPPEPGAAPRVSSSADKQAKSLVINNGNPDPFETAKPSELSTGLDPLIAKTLDEYTTTNSPAESTFLSNIGADKADSHIRDLIYQENQIEPEPRKDATPLESLLGNDKAVEPVLDPKAEAERIRSNKDEGKPVTDGDVKSVDTKPASIVDQIFK